jgi:outer membrane protein assembly factor BamB
VLWRRPLGDGYSSIVFDRGALYTLYRGDDEEILAALEATTGETLWRYAWQAPSKEFMDTEFGPGPHSTPLISGERVIAVGATGRLVALDRASGRLVWERQLWDELRGTPLERGYAASPIAFRDLVILPVGGSDQAVVAFRQSDGTIAWQAGDDDIAYASPILANIDDTTELITLLKTEIVGWDPSTGRELWVLPITDERFVNVATPLFSSDDLLFFDSSAGGRVLHLQRTDGTTRPRELWLAKVIGSQVGNVIRLGDYLFGTLGRSAASFMTAVKISTGEIAWRSREIGDCTLVVAGDKVLALESDGTLRMIELSAAGLTTVAEARVLEGRSWTPPTLVGTAIYLRNRREAVALDLGDRSE